MKNQNIDPIIKIVPIITYYNVLDNKTVIYKQNKNKSGIYRWNNLITRKSYIGSAQNLNNRLSNYMSSKFLEKELKRNKSIISNSLLKNNYLNFSLDILEYCEIDQLIKREQYYIDLLAPEYNILKVANSRLGMKHSQETLLKFKNRRHSIEAKTKMSLAKKGKPLPYSELRVKNHKLAITLYITTVLNTKDNSVKSYDSLRSAAKDFNTSHTTLLYYIKNNKLYKNMYLITNKLKTKY